MHAKKYLGYVLLPLLLLLVAFPLIRGPLSLLFFQNPNLQERPQDSRVKLPAWHARVKQSIANAAPGVRVKVSIASDHSSEPFSHFGDEPAYLASAVKILVLAALYDAKEKGSLKFTEKVRYSRADVRDGAPAMNRNKFALYSVHALMLYMIRDSDNAATDLLMKHLGHERLYATLEKLGLGDADIVNLMDVRVEVFSLLDERARDLSAVDIRDVRWRNGFEPRLDLLQKHIGKPYGDYDDESLELAYTTYYQREKNHVSMNKMVRLMNKLRQGELISKKSDAKMLEMLHNVWTSDKRSSKYLPEGASVAHKTGTQHKRVIDVGVLFAPDDIEYAFAIAVEGGVRSESEEMIAQIVRALF